MINKKNITILIIILNLFFCKNVFASSYIENDILIEKNISLITKNFDKSIEDIKKIIKNYNICEKYHNFNLLEDKKTYNINIDIKLEDYTLLIKEIENLNYIKLLSKEEIFLNEYIEKIKNIQKEKINYKNEIENKINSCELSYINYQIELCKLEIEIEEINKLLQKEDKFINCTIYLEENNKQDILKYSKISNNYNIIQKIILFLSSLSSYFLTIILLIILIFIIKKIKKSL